MKQLGRAAALFATGLSAVCGCSSESTPNEPSSVSGALTGTTVGTSTQTTGGVSSTTGGSSVTHGSSGTAATTTGVATGTTSTSGGDTASTSGSSGASGSLGASGTLGSTGTTSGAASTTGEGTTAATGTSTSTTGGGPVGGIDGYNEDFEEFVGEDCELPEPMQLSPASHSLPDPFLKPDGTRMSSLSEWACQRG